MLTQAFLRIFAEKVLNSGLSVSESKNVAVVAKPYLKSSSAGIETEHESYWKRTRRVLPVLSLLDDKTHFISLCRMEMTLFEK